MRVLVLRFSALGDVALTIPVLQQLKAQRPDLNITFVSQPQVKPLFQPLDINFFEVQYEGRHKGLHGLYALYQELLNEYRPDIVIDLHNVIRTKILTQFFKIDKIPVFTIDKGRPAKKQLTRLKNKVRIALPHTTERYAEVFEKAGVEFNYSPENIEPLDYKTKTDIDELLQRKEGQFLIGIAPFAKHKGKIWPLKKMRELITVLEKKGCKILLLGGREDKDNLNRIARESDNIFCVAGKLQFNTELVLMQHLDVVVSMDSLNMHLAALAGTPVVSIWGTTHSYAGFGPIGKNDALKVEVPLEELGCRPCSIYGKKPCYRKDYACLNWITTEQIMEKIDFVLLKQTKR